MRIKFLLLAILFCNACVHHVEDIQRSQEIFESLTPIDVSILRSGDVAIRVTAKYATQNGSQSSEKFIIMPGRQILRILEQNPSRSKSLNVQVIDMREGLIPEESTRLIPSGFGALEHSKSAQIERERIKQQVVATYDLGESVPYALGSLNGNIVFSPDMHIQGTRIRTTAAGKIFNLITIPYTVILFPFAMVQFLRPHSYQIPNQGAGRA